MIQEAVERDSLDVFTLLRTFAPRWLRLCNLDNPKSFNDWFWTRNVRTFIFPQGVVFATEHVPHLRATLHPLFWAKRPGNAPQTLKACVKDLFHLLDVQRLDVHVFETAGHTIRRILREVGFTHEGTLRAYDFDPTHHPALISTEIWSILRVEILEV